jgi:hypothetical protein
MNHRQNQGTATASVAHATKVRSVTRSNSTIQALRGPWAVVISVFVVALLSIIAVGALMLAHLLEFGLGLDRASDLGVELIGGSVIGLALLGAEIGFGLQLQRLEGDRTRAFGGERQEGS